MSQRKKAALTSLDGTNKRLEDVLRIGLKHKQSAPTVDGRTPVPSNPGALNPFSPFPPAEYQRVPYTWNTMAPPGQEKCYAQTDPRRLNAGLWDALSEPTVDKNGNKWFYSVATGYDCRALYKIELGPDNPFGGTIQFDGPPGDEYAVKWLKNTGSSKEYIILSGGRGKEVIQEMKISAKTLMDINEVLPPDLSSNFDDVDTFQHIAGEAVEDMHSIAVFVGFDRRIANVKAMSNPSSEDVKSMITGMRPPLESMTLKLDPDTRSEPTSNAVLDRLHVKVESEDRVLRRRMRIGSNYEFYTSDMTRLKDWEIMQLENIKIDPNTLATARWDAVHGQVVEHFVDMIQKAELLEYVKHQAGAVAWDAEMFPKLDSDTNAKLAFHLADVSHEIKEWSTTGFVSMLTNEQSSLQAALAKYKLATDELLEIAARIRSGRPNREQVFEVVSLIRDKYSYMEKKNVNFDMTGLVKASAKDPGKTNEMLKAYKNVLEYAFYKRWLGTTMEMWEREFDKWDEGPGYQGMLKIVEEKRIGIRSILSEIGERIKKLDRLYEEKDNYKSSVKKVVSACTTEGLGSACLSSMLGAVF